MSERFIPEMPQRTPEQDTRNRIHNELYEFMQRINATAKEMAHASLVALGRPVDGAMMRPEIFELSQKIGEARQNGFSEKDLREMAEELYGNENPEEKLSDFLEILSITDEERDLIELILEEKKSGRLVAYKKGTGEELGSTIIEKEKVNNAKEVVFELIDFLGLYAGEEDLGVRFSELE